MNFGMIEFAFETFRTESIHIIFTDVSRLVNIEKTHWSKLAESSLIIRTFLRSFVLCWVHMSEHTFTTLATGSFLEKIFAGWNFVFLKDVEEFAVVSLFALSFEPMNTDSLLHFGRVYLLVL